MFDSQTVRIALVGLFIFVYLGMVVIAGLVWTGKAVEGHITALVGLIGPAVGAICTMLINPPHRAQQQPGDPPDKVQITGGQSGPGTEVSVSDNAANAQP